MSTPSDPKLPRLQGVFGLRTIGAQPLSVSDSIPFGVDGAAAASALAATHRMNAALRALQPLPTNSARASSSTAPPVSPLTPPPPIWGHTSPLPPEAQPAPQGLTTHGTLDDDLGPSRPPSPMAHLGETLYALDA